MVAHSGRFKLCDFTDLMVVNFDEKANHTFQKDLWIVQIVEFYILSYFILNMLNYL